jgi:hypothetical protein
MLGIGYSRRWYTTLVAKLNVSVAIRPIPPGDYKWETEYCSDKLNDVSQAILDLRRIIAGLAADTGNRHFFWLNIEPIRPNLYARICKREQYQALTAPSGCLPKL